MIIIIRLTLLLVFITCLNSKANANSTLKIEAHGAGTSKYWLIYANQDSIHANQLIVFLHGYGASNPACYGGWIRSLVEAGNIVLFPKFQNGLFFPRTSRFEKRVNKAIQAAIEKLQNEDNITINNIAFVAHSIGGTIAANLADAYGETKKYKVSSLFLAQPGYKYLKLGSKSTYHEIDATATIIIITGNKDLTAGDKFAKHFYNAIPQIPTAQKILLKQYEDKYESQRVGATHVEPISPDSELDTGNKNPIIVGALLLGKTNQVDTNCYWRLSNLLIKCSNNEDTSCDLLFQNPDNVVFTGKWANEKPIKVMEIIRGIN